MELILNLLLWSALGVLGAALFIALIVAFCAIKEVFFGGSK